MAELPSYEELMNSGSGRKRGAFYASQIDGMNPGEVREIVARDGDTDVDWRRAVQIAAGMRGFKVATRKRDGALYAIRLKPEDY